MEPAIQGLLDESIDPLFWPADRLDPAIRAWASHIPFAHWLMSQTKPNLFVELGTHSGVSYSAFCSAIVRQDLTTRAYAVDTWKGDIHAGLYGEEVYQDFLAFHDARYKHFSTPLRTTFDEALGQFADASIDLLHIDGLHTYEAVKHDFENWLPKLSCAAIVVFHDTNVRERDFGVWRLWTEISERFPAFEFLHGLGLGVLAVGPNAAPSIKALCELREPQEVTRVRNRFAAAGERWSSLMESRVQLGTAERRLTDVAASLNRLEAFHRENQRLTAELDNLAKNTGSLRTSLETTNNAVVQQNSDLHELSEQRDALLRELLAEREGAEQLAEQIGEAMNNLNVERQRSARAEQDLSAAAKDLFSKQEQLARLEEELRNAAENLKVERQRSKELDESLKKETHNLLRAQDRIVQLEEGLDNSAAELMRVHGTLAEQRSVLIHVNNSTIWNWVVKYRSWIEHHKSSFMIRFYDDSVRRLWRKT